MFQLTGRFISVTGSEVERERCAACLSFDSGGDLPKVLDSLEIQNN